MTIFSTTSLNLNYDSLEYHNEIHDFEEKKEKEKEENLHTKNKTRKHRNTSLEYGGAVGVGGRGHAESNMAQTFRFAEGGATPAK